MAKKYDKNTWMGGDIDEKELAREPSKSPKDNPKKTRGLNGTMPRSQKGPKGSITKEKSFLNPKSYNMKGSC